MIPSEIMKQIKPGAKVKVHSSWGARLSDGQGSAEGGGTSMFDGLVIARKHGSEVGATFTVRSMVAGVSVEKVFPLHSPAITKVQIVSSPKKVHRSKLYFVRGMSAARVRQKLGVSV